MTIRIHSGRWKGTKLTVANLPGVRPTSSRMRETLANWIRHEHSFTNVLDLFAGSGALGLEVCSNLNGHITFVDNDTILISAIEERINHLGYDRAKILMNDAIDFINSTEQQFDLVLLDPPYSFKDIDQLPNIIESSGILVKKASVYFEYHLSMQPTFPKNWTRYKFTKVSNVQAGLWRRK